MSNLPVIAIVGRPNVGKSSLLNALAGKLISIVEDMPGVTRDRISTPLWVGSHYVELVDTGGFGFVDPDKLTDHIRQQIDLALAQAKLVLFVVDCQTGMTAVDREIATLLRTKSLKTVIIGNKADGASADVALGDFARLGFGTPIGVSARTGRNIDQILEAIRKNVDLTHAPTDIPEPQMKLAIVGKRNAGKSTLVNAIARLYEGDVQRVIVSEVPGTTRDSVDVRFEKDGKSLIVIDTAGVRKKKRTVANDVEYYSFHRAERSIRRADVCMLLIDSAEPISEPDKKLARYVAEQYKPVILVVNKWDLALEAMKEGEVEADDRALMEKYREYLDIELKHVNYAPIVFITANEGKNVQAGLDLAQFLFKQANSRVTTGRLNQAISAILEEKRPSTSAGRRARIYYATQTDVAPPTIVLFVNKPDYFDDSYARFMMNRMRELLPYAHVPFKLVFRARVRSELPPTNKALDDGAERPQGRRRRRSKK